MLICFELLYRNTLFGNNVANPFRRATAATPFLPTVGVLVFKSHLRTLIIFTSSSIFSFTRRTLLPAFSFFSLFGIWLSFNSGRSLTEFVFLKNSKYGQSSGFTTCSKLSFSFYITSR